MATSSAKSIVLSLTLLLPGCTISEPSSTSGVAPATNFPTENQHNSTTPKPDHSTQSRIIKISAVGDIMLGGTAEPILDEHGYDYPFEKVQPVLKDSDIVIGNLEGPLTTAETPYNPDKAYLFKTPPDKVAPALKKAGFTILNLANNHILDYGKQGLIDTIQALESHQLQHVGAGFNIQQARQAHIVQSKGYRLGFLSYSLTFPKSFWAGNNTPGTAFGHEHEIRADVKKLKQITDVVIVSFHWGTEKSTALRDYQPMLAHAAIDEGASIILGHHPHVLQAIENYKHGIILYSLGNFTFGSYSKASDVSVIAILTLRNGEISRLELHPINVLNVDVNFQPQLLAGDESEAVIQQINRLSESKSTKFSITQGIGVLSKQNSVAIKY